jgi:hypothetical protein
VLVQVVAAQRNAALKPVDRAREQELSVDPELRAKLELPLRGELRAAQDREPGRLPGREKLGRDEACLDGLADPDPVRDQEPRGV